MSGDCNAFSSEVFLFFLSFDLFVSWQILKFEQDKEEADKAAIEEKMKTDDTLKKEEEDKKKEEEKRKKEEEEKKKDEEEVSIRDRLG